MKHDVKKTKKQKSKIACVTITDFAVEICRQDNPHLACVPFAIADSELDSAEITAANQQAKDAGLLLNVTVAQGHILCPDLIVTIRDTDREIEQSNVIYKKLQSLSPFVEESQPGLYFLDASGLELLYKSDRQFATRIIATVKACGVPPYCCRVGIGINKFVAQTAANLSEPDRFTIVPYGNEKTFLRNLPLAQLQTDPLRLSSDVLTSLNDLGLKTIGQAATFPANEMIRRFGPQGETLSRLARGDDTVFFAPETPVELLSETIWLDNPLEQTETILNLVEQMLTPLLAELGRYCQGCATIEVTFHLDRPSSGASPLSCQSGPHKSFRRRPESMSGELRKNARGNSEKEYGSKHLSQEDASVLGEMQVTMDPSLRWGDLKGTPDSTVSLPITVERPTLSATIFLRQLRNLLEKETSGAPPLGVGFSITGLTLTIPLVTTLFSEQLALADRLTGPTTSRLDLPESSAVTKIIRRDLFLPEQRFVLSPITVKTKPEPSDAPSLWARHCPYSHRPTDGLRLYQPPREIKVIAESAENNTPVAINRTTVIGRGPWELSGQWWSRNYDRHYWNIRTTEGGHFLIYHDRRTSRWFLQGVFD